MEQWKAYLEALSSKAPVPGGGGASAVCGALGVALGEMVGNLTVGKKKYAQWEPEVKECLLRLEAARGQFMELSDEDARVFEPLSKAYGIKAETEEEKAKKAYEEYRLFTDDVYHVGYPDKVSSQAGACVQFLMCTSPAHIAIEIIEFVPFRMVLAVDDGVGLRVGCYPYRITPEQGVVNIIKVAVGQCHLGKLSLARYYQCIGIKIGNKIYVFACCIGINHRRGGKCVE